MPELGWLALFDEPRAGTTPVGTGLHLLLEIGRAKPVRSAVRVEPTLIGNGPALAVSLVLPLRDERPLFDDPAVVHAMRAVLRDPHRAPLFSTLVDGSTHFAGAISGQEPEVVRARPAWWREDPFARFGRQQRLLVPAGVLRPVPLPVGPGHQRHAGAPWPWGRFSTPAGHPLWTR